MTNYESMVQKLLGLTPDADGKPIVVGWSDDAASLWEVFFNENVTMQEREKNGGTLPSVATIVH